MSLKELYENNECWFCKYHLENRKDPGDYNDDHENYCCYPDNPNMYSNIKFQIKNQTVYKHGKDDRCPLVYTNKDLLIMEYEKDIIKMEENDEFLKDDFIPFYQKQISLLKELKPYQPLKKEFIE